MKMKKILKNTNQALKDNYLSIYDVWGSVYRGEIDVPIKFYRQQSKLQLERARKLIVILASQKQPPKRRRQAKFLGHFF